MFQAMTLGLAAGILAAVVGASASAGEIEVGSKAPDFKATGVDGKSYALDSTKSAKATVLCFTCNLCPVAVAYEDRLNAFAKKYSEKGVQLIALNCNKTEDLEAMKKRAEEKDFGFPYAYDGSAAAAKAYGARVTPHLFVIDANGKVVYRGSFDDSQNNPAKSYVEDAVNAVLAGKTPAVASTKAFGCSIKNDLN